MWIRLRSWRTATCVSHARWSRGSALTSYAREELSREALNLRAGEGYKSVPLEEVEDALSEEVGYNTDVIAEVERVAQVYAFISVCLVVQRQR